MAELGFEAGFNTGEDTPLQKLQQYLAGRGAGPAPAIPDIQQQPITQLPITPTANVPSSKSPFRSYMEAVDYMGNEVVIQSVGNKPKTETDFATAMDAYNNSKGRPQKGFNVLDLKPVVDLIRGATPEQIQQSNYPQQSVAEARRPLWGSSPQAMFQQPVTPQDIQNPLLRGTANIVREGVKDLPSIGFTAGTAAVGGTLLKGTATAAKPLFTGLMNMVKMGLGGMLGAESGALASGKGVDLGRAATEFVYGAGGQGVVGTVSHWIQKYLTKGIGEKVAGQIIDEIKKKYPHIANDPQLFNIAFSNADNLAFFTQVGKKALLTDLDNATASLIDNVQRALGKTTLSAKTGPTVRAQIRRLVDKGQDLVAATGDIDQAASLRSEMNTIAGSIRQNIVDEFTNRYGTVAAQNKLPVIVDVLKDFEKSVASLQEGAHVINAFTQAKLHEGYDPIKLAQTIRGTYKQQPGTLLERVGDILGQGRSLTAMPQPQQTSEPGMALFNLLKQAVPQLNYLPIGPKTSVQQLPWQSGSGQAVKEGLTSSAISTTIRAYLKEKEKR